MASKTESAATSTARGGVPGWLHWAGIAVGLVGLYVLGRYLGGYLQEFSHWVEGLGAWGPVLFILGYAVATVALAPGSIMTLAAGAVFGLAEGVLWVFIGASLGACLAFLVSRYLARRAVEHRLADNEKFSRLDSAVGREGLKIVTLLRLSPVFPFNLLNYGLGLTSVKFWHYALACFGMLPGTLLYVYYGKVAGDVAVAASGAVEKDWRYWTVLGVGLVATILVTLVITRLARRALSHTEAAAPVAAAPHPDSDDNSSSEQIPDE